MARTNMSVPVAAHGNPVKSVGRKASSPFFSLIEMRTPGLLPSRMNPSISFSPSRPSESDRHFGYRLIASRCRNGGRIIGGNGLSTFCGKASPFPGLD
jgi:hypothetical protein